MYTTACMVHDGCTRTAWSSVFPSSSFSNILRDCPPVNILFEKNRFQPCIRIKAYRSIRSLPDDGALISTSDANVRHCEDSFRLKHDFHFGAIYSFTFLTCQSACYFARGEDRRLVVKVSRGPVPAPINLASYGPGSCFVGPGSYF
jgi:hypothetical protein